MVEFHEKAAGIVVGLELPQVYGIRTTFETSMCTAKVSLTSAKSR